MATDDPDRLRNSLLTVQKLMEAQLKHASQSVVHAGTMGEVNEKNWMELLRSYLPRRYEVNTGIVVDSRGGYSDQIDIIIYDGHFTPVLLGQQNHRYVPAEAVYAVFECKPEINTQYLEYAGDKAASVRSLHRTSREITTIEGRARKSLFPIAAGILAQRAWSRGLEADLSSNLPTEEASYLNFGCAVSVGAFFWEGTELVVAPGEGSLMRFLFRLLLHLQDLGSAPAVEWGDYEALLR